MASIEEIYAPVLHTDQGCPVCDAVIEELHNVAAKMSQHDNLPLIYNRIAELRNKPTEIYHGTLKRQF